MDGTIEWIKETLERDEAAIWAAFQKMITHHAGHTEERACMMWAMVLHRHFGSLGVESMLQAGTASFQFIEPYSEHDNEGGPTHYSYMCEDGAEFLKALMINRTLPEMHAWVVVPNRIERKYVLVDWTTRYLVSLAETKGFIWREPFPPMTLVCETTKLPSGWQYIAKDAPTKFLMGVEGMTPR